MRTRDRASAAGLLPRMEARPRKDGLVTYRYHPVGGTPVNLGTDKGDAIRRVADMLGTSSDAGTVAELWRTYVASADWRALADGTRRQYTESSKPLLEVFADVPVTAITPAHVARYLRSERGQHPVSANREIAVLSNLMRLAVERGEIDRNPCREVRRNAEHPRTEAPEPAALALFLAWAGARQGQARILAGMAEFAALTGSRRAEFMALTWPHVSADAIRLPRAKQRGRQKIDAVQMSPALLDLLDRMRPLAADDRLGYVFPTRDGNAYSEPGFKAMWARLVASAITAKIIAGRLRFHDLRAYYVTQHKALRGALPDLHADPGTTARVYDRTKEVKRSAL